MGAAITVAAVTIMAVLACVVDLAVMNVMNRGVDRFAVAVSIYIAGNCQMAVAGGQALLLAQKLDMGLRIFGLLIEKLLVDVQRFGLQVVKAGQAVRETLQNLGGQSSLLRIGMPGGKNRA